MIFKKTSLISISVFVAFSALEISFLNIPGTEIEGGRAGGLAHIKFALYTFALLIILLCYFHIPKGVIEADRSIFWFFAYLLVSAGSLIGCAFTVDNFDAISWARLLGLFYFLPYFWVLKHLGTEKIYNIALLSKLMPIGVLAFVFILNRDAVFRTVWVDSYLSSNRLGGDIIPPNTLGGMLSVCAILMAGSLYRRKTLKLLLIAALAILVLITQSRSAFLGLITSLAFGYIVTKNEISKYLKIVVGISVIVAIFSFLYAHIDPLLVRVTTGISSFGGRTTLWGQAYRQFADSDFFKIFFGFGYMLPNSWFTVGGLNTNSLHNGYFQILFGTGILGLFCYAMIWISLIRKKIKYANDRDYTFYSLTIFLLIFNLTELGSFVLVNSLSLVLLVLMGANMDGYKNCSKARCAF